MSTPDFEEPLADVGLSPRTVAALARANIVRMRDLVGRTDVDILKMNELGVKSLREIKAALAALGLSLGMRLPEPARSEPPPSEIALRVLDGDAASIDALARGDASIWQPWFEHLVLNTPAPEVAVIERMLAREPNPRRWLEIAKAVLPNIDSARFTTTLQAMRPFQAWFGDGIVAARGITARAALEIRLERETREAVGADVARAIVADLRAAGSDDQLLSEALVLLAKRLAEEDQHETAVDVLAEAADRLRAAGDVAGRALARRLCAGSLLRLRRLDDAFAILDREMEGRRSDGFGGASRISRLPDDKWDAALDEAAEIAIWAAATTPEWVRALGGLAQRADVASRKALWQRFECALVAMVDASDNPGSDLEIVVRQAKVRRFVKTARAAEDLAKRRGIELVANPYFG